MEKINVVVLAGDSKKTSIEEGVNNKALFLIEGKPMVEYVVDALRDARVVGKISIVGPVKELKGYLNDKVDYYYEGKDSFFDNVNIGLIPFINDKRALIVTSDIPMISGEMIDDFVKRCEEHRSDLCYPVVDKKINEEKFPGVQRTYVKLKEGTYTGGNAIYFNPKVVQPCEEFAKKAIEYRKKPWKTGRLLGLKFLVMLFLGRQSLPKVEQRFSSLLNIKAVAIVTPYPELGNDVDKPSDVEMVRKYFRQNKTQ